MYEFYFVDLFKTAIFIIDLMIWYVIMFKVIFCYWCTQIKF